jgi:hypothetical protein
LPLPDLAFFLNTVYDYAPERNGVSNREVAEMATREITMRLPEELLQSLDEVLERQSLTRDEALIRLVEDYVQRRGVAREIALATLDRLRRGGLGFYGDLTYRYLSGELEHTGSIDDIELDSEEIAEAIYQTFGTRDPIELIEKVRHREL